MTFAEFNGWFALEICRYNNSIHSSLGCTPVAKWDALSGEMASDIPFDMDAFRVGFLPSERRQIRRDGVHLFKIRYWSEGLAGQIGRKDGKAVLRYDPRNLSSIWVELEAGRGVGRCHSRRCATYATARRTPLAKLARRFRVFECDLDPYRRDADREDIQPKCQITPANSCFDCRDYVAGFLVGKRSGHRRDPFWRGMPCN